MMDRLDDLPEVEIIRFTLHNILRTNSTSIAFAVLRVGDITVHGATIRRPYDHTLDAYVLTPGRGTGGISIARASATRKAISDAMLARYEDETGRQA